jgi:gamma-glutamyltranspeptidase / glutathione hydrolase
VDWIIYGLLPARQGTKQEVCQMKPSRPHQSDPGPALGRGLLGAVMLMAGVFTWAPDRADAAAASPLLAREGMVVTESPEASLVGAELLRGGANAVDAAVAVHFALAVAYPQAGNLGGGGFMLIRMADGTTEAIDFRETAPGTATRDLFLAADGQPDPYLSTSTVLAAGVPGAVAGMARAHERHSTQEWGDLIQPAIRLAQEGFTLDHYTAHHLRQHQGRLRRHPEAERIYLRGGDFYEEGDTFRQPELAETLGRIALYGPGDFYTGETARLIVEEMRRQGGLITEEDLRAYRPVVRNPLEGTYRGRTILTMPPPSSGGIALLQALAMVEPHPLAEYGPLASQSCHLLTEAMRRAFADRAEFLGDADHTPIPVAGLLSRAYLDSLTACISPYRATPSLDAGAGQPPGAAAFYEATGGQPGVRITPPDPSRGGVESRQTTHVSILDRFGNAVSMTTTLNTSYGSGHMVTGSGFLLNNQMDDFAALPGSPNYYGLIQGEANAVRAFARPLSSMTPTIVVRDGGVELVLGSPGGPRIITAVLQTLINVIDHDMDIQAAIAGPRIHHQWWPDELKIERHGLPRDVLDALSAKGHALGSTGSMGSVQGVQVLRRGEDVHLLGGTDPRRNGCCAGVSRGRVVSRCGPPSVY